MSDNRHARDPEHADRLMMYALGTLPAREVPAMEAHLAECAECRGEVAGLRPVVDSFVAWPRAVVRPTTPLWQRLALRVEQESGAQAPADLDDDDWKEPEWQEAAPGLTYQVLSNDADTHRVTLLVRLEPGADYPPHVHAGLEELHLLEGELWIDERKLKPGDCNRAEAGTGDKRVWSETGCTCVLITSSRDILG